MSEKPRQVDLGPLYLPLGEERQRSPVKVKKTLPSGRREDVERFRALMGDVAAQPAQGPHAMAPLSLLARREGDDPRREYASAEAERSPSGLASAMERLWAGEGLHGEREVRIGLRNTILPDTAVRMRQVQGRLQLELSCLDARVSVRLASRLDALACELGSRLGRTVVASVEHIDHGLVRSVSWFRECP